MRKSKNVRFDLFTVGKREKGPPLGIVGVERKEEFLLLATGLNFHLSALFHQRVLNGTLALVKFFMVSE